MTKEEKKRLARFWAGCEKCGMTKCKNGWIEKCEMYKKFMKNPF